MNKATGGKAAPATNKVNQAADGVAKTGGGAVKGATGTAGGAAKNVSGTAQGALGNLGNTGKQTGAAIKKGDIKGTASGRFSTGRQMSRSGCADGHCLLGLASGTGQTVAGAGKGVDDTVSGVGDGVGGTVGGAGKNLGNTIGGKPGKTVSGKHSRVHSYGGTTR